jgi:TATA-box binding protein (TBP) (component of TFIID and TFIIIB)
MNARAAAAVKIQRALRARKASAFSNESRFSEDGYKMTKPVTTAKTVTLYVPWGAFSLPDTLPAGVTSVEGRILIGNPPTCRLTRTHGLVGDPTGVAHWNFRTEGGGSAVLHKSSSMHITTSGQATYEPVLRKVARFFPGLRVNTNTVKLTKVDGRLNIDHKIILDDMARHFARNVPSSVGTISNEPELFSSGAFVHWKSPAMTLVFFTNGTVLIRGTKNLSAAPIVIHRIIQYVGPLNMFKRQVATGLNGRRLTNASGRPVYEPLAATRMRAVPTASRNKNAQRLAKLNVRYPRARSYANARAGMYVRPGPNGLPRFYPVVANMSLVHQKALRAYANAGVNMPANVLAVFGGAAGGSVVAPKKSPPRRAPNWNANRPGFYVRPGPGKQPYFYKIPTGKAAGRKTVLKAYENAGVRVPQRVKNIFGITGSVSPTRVAGVYNVSGNRIDGKQYSRYTVAQLVRIARNMNIPGASENRSAAQIFAMIKNKRGASPSPTSNRGPNVTVNGRHYTFSEGLNGRITRNGRARQFNTLTRAERLAVARAFIQNNATYTNFEKMKSKNWYNTLKAVKASRASPSPTSSVNSNLVREFENAMR